MPKPANGRYRMTQTVPPPLPGEGPWDVRVTDTALLCWPFSYSVASPGVYTLAPGIGVECLGNGRYIAVGPQGNREGTCEYLGP